MLRDVPLAERAGMNRLAAPARTSRAQSPARSTSSGSHGIWKNRMYEERSHRGTPRQASRPGCRLSRARQLEQGRCPVPGQARPRLRRASQHDSSPRLPASRTHGSRRSGATAWNPASARAGSWCLHQYQHSGKPCSSSTGSPRTASTWYSPKDRRVSPVDPAGFVRASSHHCRTLPLAARPLPRCGCDREGKTEQVPMPCTSCP